MMPDITGPIMPVDATRLEKDSADTCQGCGRDAQDCGPVVRYCFPLYGMEPSDYDRLFFCRECSLLVAGVIEECWHQHDLHHGTRPNSYYLLRRAASHMTQATLLLSRMEP